MKLAASIYSSKSDDKTKLIKTLDKYGLDFFHIDCNDDINVFEDIKLIRKISKTPIDLHIISPEPEKFYRLIHENQVDSVTFQYENLKKKIEIPQYIKSKIGIAIVSETNIDVFEQYQERCSFILMMTTVPGKSGGSFNEKNFQKIQKFRKKYPYKKVHVDGGVNAEVSFILRNLGVYFAVVGSYLFKNEYIGISMLNLKKNAVNSQFKIKDFMQTQDLPIINPKDYSFKNLIEVIDKYQMGYAIIVDKNNQLEGIITNADLRKGLIKNFDDLNKIEIKNIINRNPVIIKEDKSVANLISLIKNRSFPILYLPVVNQNREVVGSVSFNNLIKGES